MQILHTSLPPIDQEIFTCTLISRCVFTPHFAARFIPSEKTIQKATLIQNHIPWDLRHNRELNTHQGDFEIRIETGTIPAFPWESWMKQLKTLSIRPVTDWSHCGRDGTSYTLIMGIQESQLQISWWNARLDESWQPLEDLAEAMEAQMKQFVHHTSKTIRVEWLKDANSEVVIRKE